jgi:hypothetical protein
MGAASPIYRVLDQQPSANLRVEVINGAGPLLPEEAPDQVLELALAFLTASGDCERDPGVPGAAGSDERFCCRPQALSLQLLELVLGP